MAQALFIWQGLKRLFRIKDFNIRPDFLIFKTRKTFPIDIVFLT